jgi:hypothetical protein
MLNEQKVTYKMKTLIESGFFGNKGLISEALADKDRIRLFQAAYNRTYDKNLAVDGIKGAQTDAAIADVKQKFSLDKLDNANTEVFYLNFLDILKLDNTINVGQGGANTNKNQNYAVQVLSNLAGQPIGIDGVIGTKSIEAIKALTGANVINKDNIGAVIEKAKANIKELGVEDIATVKAKTPEEIQAESRKVWEKYPCVTKAEGIQEVILNDNTIVYKNNAFTYYGNGRRMQNDNSQMSDYYCNGMTVVAGKMADNTKAEGKCEEGNCVNGTGKLITAAGDTHVGVFVNGKLTGTDNEIFFKAFSSYFKGETKDGQMVKGAYRFKDSTFYEGFFLNGKMHSDNALYMNAKGKKWKGNFRNGAPVGATFAELNAPENDNKITLFSTPERIANLNIGNEMKKIKDAIDKKINDGTISNENIISGRYSKLGNGLQILDSNDDLIYTTTIIPDKLATINQGKWSYYTGGSGAKIINFGTNNSMSKFIYNFSK